MKTFIILIPVDNNLVVKGLVAIAIMILASCEVEPLDCNCQEETTGQYQYLVGGEVRHYVNYKDAPYANCEDDGKIIALEALSTTRIVCD